VAPDAAPHEVRKTVTVMFADVRGFTKGAPQSDDITALILRYGPGA
jgi:class 3 adenylate cyclase